MRSVFAATVAFWVLAFAFTAREAGGVDYWISGTDASVVTNNDCGFVSALHGQASIVRSFHDPSAPGVRANVTDRVYSGDVVRVSDGGRLEVTSGTNVVAVFGGGSRAKYLGLRTFSNAVVRTVTRVDMELLSGEMRVQARLNEARPELALVSTQDGELLLQRGDVAVTNGGGWQAAVLSGEALLRLRRSGTVGAPFSLAEGNLLGSGGRGVMPPGEKEKTRARVPFSFELRRSALPPLPSLAHDVEAP